MPLSAEPHPTPGPTPLRVISSMATRQLLNDATEAWKARTGESVRIESVGGIDAAGRVQAGEGFDIVVLAASAIDGLMRAGSVTAGSKTDLVHSGVAACVRAGTAAPRIETEAALKAAVQSARSIGYSTGPSGVALMRLFEQWGLAAEVVPRCVQASAGVPVATLVACGEVELGFQQLSELMFAQGITVIGPLPEAVQITTTFSAGLCAKASNVDAARAFVAFLASPELADIKRRNGMQPA